MKVVPFLFEEFGSPGLGKEFGKMEKNEGYSFFSHSGKEESPYAGCDLLVLRMEDSHNWPSILNAFVLAPRNDDTYRPYRRQPTSRLDRCPYLADHYKTVQDYQIDDA